MESVNEVIILSESGNKDANCTMYDPHTTRVLETYKDAHSVRNGLALIGDDFLISASKDKPTVKVWAIGRANHDHHSMTMPGFVSALAVSKCGNYCIAGIGKATYIWEVSTGDLLFCMECHVQDITCVRFSSDGSHFITGGKDGMVLVFLLSEVVALRDSPIEVPKPRFSWAHVSEITDIYVGNISFYARVATVSKDMTCRIYELDTGCLLSTIHVGFPITAITMDICEYFLFLGSEKGDIYRINLFSCKDGDIHYEDVEKENVFVGHSGEITGLCVSPSGLYLVSASADKTCVIWDLTNFSLLSKITPSGPITNMLCIRCPPGLKDLKRKPRAILNSFSRNCREGDTEFVPVNILSHKLSLFHAASPDKFFDPQVLKCSSECLEKIIARGSLSVDDMVNINNDMYAFALSDALECIGIDKKAV